MNNFKCYTISIMGFPTEECPYEIPHTIGAFRNYKKAKKYFNEIVWEIKQNTFTSPFPCDTIAIFGWGKNGKVGFVLDEYQK